MRPYALLLSLLIPLAHAEWVKVEGVEHFGPETAEKTACRAAESKAINTAIQKVSGEAIATSQHLVCNDSRVEVCQLLMSSITHTEGVVAGLKKVKEEVVARACYVALEVDVVKDDGDADVSFDPEIRMSQTRLRDGERFKVIIKPNKSFYLNIFIFSPYASEHKQLMQLFPSDIEESRVFDMDMEFPTTSVYTANIPKGLRVEIADAVLIAVATKKEVILRKNFSLAEFNRRMREIPKKERRIIRIPFSIWAARPEYTMKGE
jgi:hypothetical protein